MNSTGWLGHALARALLRARWLRWRWRRRRAPATTGSEPARDFLWTPDWYERFRSSAPGESSGDAWCRTIFPGFRTDPPPIKALDAATASAIQLPCRRTLPATFVAQVPRARIVSNRGDVISPDGRWLADLSVGHPRWVSRTHRFVNEPIAPRCEDLRGTALLLAHPYAEVNYFHWLFNCVPRLELYRLADVDLDEVDHVVVSANHGAYRNETLERLGVPLDRLVECHERFHARAERVLATSNIYFAYVRPWAHDFLRETFLPSEPPAGSPERIVVRREPDRGRPLVNELECVGVLEQRGFVSVRLTGMTVVEQAALFARARCVASPHEAGLSNLVFCRPGTTVIELFSPKLLHAHYAELSALRGLEYFCLIGEDEPAEGRRAYRVPIDTLERLLDAAGLGA